MCVKNKLLCVKTTGIWGFLVTMIQPNLGKDIKLTHKLIGEQFFFNIREQFNADYY